MSIWTSVSPQSDDVIDVAYSLYEDKVRVVMQDDYFMYLTLNQAALFVDKLKIAIAKQDGSNGQAR